MTLAELWYNSGSLKTVGEPIVWEDEIPAINIYVGFQIAGDRVTIFRSDKASNSEDKMKCGWKFSEVRRLQRDTYEYFANGCILGFDGEIVEAPDLRAVLEVEASADSRPENEDPEEADPSPTSDQNDFLADFRVTPAYQFDVFLEYPAFVTNRATVAQLVMTGVEDDRGGELLAVRTYDTHGTDHKGFRQDEREYERSKGN